MSGWMGNGQQGVSMPVSSSRAQSCRVPRSRCRLKLDENVSLEKIKFFCMDHDGGSMFVYPVEKEILQAQKKVGRKMCEDNFLHCSRSTAPLQAALVTVSKALGAISIATQSSCRVLSGPLPPPLSPSPWVSAVCCVLIDAHPSFCPHQVVEHLESDLGVQVQRVSIHKMKYSFQIWSAMMSSQDSDGTVGDTWGHGGTLQCFYLLAKPRGCQLPAVHLRACCKGGSVCSSIPALLG